MRGIQGLLKGLFVGRLIGDPPNGYAGSVIAQQIQNSGDSVDRLPCAVPLTDAELGVIDPAYSSLKNHNKSAWEVIAQYYGGRDAKCRGNDAEIAKSVILPGGKLTTDGVRAIRESGEAWLSDRTGIPI